MPIPLIAPSSYDFGVPGFNPQQAMLDSLKYGQVQQQGTINEQTIQQNAMKLQQQQQQQQAAKDMEEAKVEALAVVQNPNSTPVDIYRVMSKMGDPGTAFENYFKGKDARAAQQMTTQITEILAPMMAGKSAVAENKIGGLIEVYKNSGDPELMKDVPVMENLRKGMTVNPNATIYSLMAMLPPETRKSILETGGYFQKEAKNQTAMAQDLASAGASRASAGASRAAAGLSAERAATERQMRPFKIDEIKSKTGSQGKTELMKNLLGMGLVQGTPEFNQAMVEGMRKTPLVQIGVDDEQKELGKLRAKSFGALEERAASAQEQINNLEILSSIDVATGRAEPMKQALAAWAEGLGVNAAGLANVAAGEAHTAQAGKLILDVMSQQKGPQTESDRKAIAQTMASLGKTPEANIFIINTAKAIADRTVEQYKFHSKYLDKNGTTKGLVSDWSEYKSKVPLLSKYSKKDGLPLFFYEFKEKMKQAHPDATDEDVLETWDAQEKAMKEAK